MAQRTSDSELTGYPRPSVAVDSAVLTVPSAGSLSVVLTHDRSGDWRLPGTFLHEEERLADAVARSLREKTGLTGIRPRQLEVFDDPDRDDRGWVLSVAHMVAVPHDAVRHVGLPGSPDAAVRPVATVGRLPFDHNAILDMAVERVARAYRRRPDPFGMLGRSFTLRELQQLHEAVTGKKWHRDAFRRLMQDQLRPTGEQSSGSVGRPAASFTTTER